MVNIGIGLSIQLTLVSVVALSFVIGLNVLGQGIIPTVFNLLS